jgi:hypothetical protein
MPLHVIVATGYDDTHALIADNDRAEIQRCSLASLREARSAGGFPLPAMNVTFEIEWPASLPPLEALVLDAMAETARWLHDPSGIPAQIFGRESFGLPAMNRLEAAAHAWKREPPRDAALHAMMLWIGIEKGGTGGGLFRRLWRDFLREAYDLTPNPALAMARDHYAQLADAWTSLGISCGTGRFEGAPDKLLDLVTREREGAAMLARIASS